MNGLPVVTAQQFGEESVQAIDSVALHEFLGIGTEHGKWIARRIETYGFVEGVDYVCSAEVASKGRGGHNRLGYFISIDMGKQLAMVEKGEKGRQVRAYFLACERAAKAVAHQQPVPAELDARLTRLEQQVAIQGQKAIAFDHLASLPGAVSLREAAKLLHVKPRALLVWLSEAGWIFRARDWGTWQGYQRRIDDGHLCHVMVPIERSDGRRELQAQCKVTPKGLTRLAQLLATGNTPPPAQAVTRTSTTTTKEN